MEENNPAVFVVTTAVLAELYGLEIVELVGVDNLNNAMRRCLQTEESQAKLFTLIETVGAELAGILRLTRPPLEEAIPFVSREAAKIIAAAAA